MSQTIRAIFENGVFRPTGPVNLPDRSEVEFEPRPVAAPVAEPNWDELYAILGQSVETGEPDMAAIPPHTWDQVFADKLAIRTGDPGDECQVTRDDLLF
jgi:predicted DNA-binding antitoxin AbrB/MazE fold protein